MTKASPARRSRKAATAAPAGAPAAETPKELKPQIAKVYVAFAWEKEDGSAGFGWKIIAGITTIRTAAEIGNTIAYLEQDGGYSDVTILSWQSLED